MQGPIQIPESIILQIRENSHVCVSVCMMCVGTYVLQETYVKQSQSKCEEVQSTLFSLILGLGSILHQLQWFLIKTPNCFYNSSYSNMLILRTHSNFLTT